MPNRYIFLDWAGDTGFKFGRGSTTHLVLAFATVPNYQDFRQAMQMLRIRRQIARSYEYHYAHIAHAERSAYFAALHHTEFHSWVLVVDKRRLPARLRRYNQYDLLAEFTYGLARRIPAEVFRDAILIVDTEPAKRKLVQAVRTAVSRALSERRAGRGIRKARGRPAHQEDGLQLADMIAGAVVSDVVKGHPAYLQRVKGQVIVWHYAI